MSDLSLERIAERAYLRYLERGGEDGHAEEDWFAAEADLLAEAEALARSEAGDPRPEGQVEPKLLASRKKEPALIGS